MSAQIMPQMAIQPNGDLIVAWWDNKFGTGWDIYITRISEATGVLIFSTTDHLVSDTSHTPPPNGSGSPWLGEYFALEADAVNAYVVFPGPPLTSDGSDALYADIVPTATIL